MFADLLSQPSRSAMERLLQFYTNPDLRFTFANNSVTTIAIPGEIVRKKVSSLDSKYAALKCEGIQREHVLKYLGLPDTVTDNDPVLARAADLLSISTLLFTTSTTDAPKVRECILEVGREKNPTFSLRQDSSKLMAYLEKPATQPDALSNEELSALQRKIVKALASSWDQTTRNTVAYVETGTGLPSAVGAVKEIGKVLMDVLKDGMTEQEIVQHKKQIVDEPGTDLKEIDFNGYGNTERKALIVASLAKLKHIPATSERVEPMFIEFNKVIRGIFDKYPEENRTEQQKNQIEAKLKYTLNKIAVVLRQKKFYKEAEDIADHFNPDATKGKNVVKAASSKSASDAERKSLVKSIIDRLDKLTKYEAPGIFAGMKNAVLGKNEDETPTFKFKDFFKNIDQAKGKEDTKVGPIELPKELEEKIEKAGLNDKQLYDLISVLKKNDAIAAEPQRKLANRMQKLVRDLHEIEREKKLQAELQANGVEFSADSPIHKIQPLTKLYDNFEESYKKLVARVKVPANDEEKKKAYYDEAAIYKARDAELADIQREMTAKQRIIDAEIASLQNRLQNDNDPERRAEYENRLDKLASIKPQADQNAKDLKAGWLAKWAVGDEDLNKVLVKAREQKEAFDKASEKILADKPKLGPMQGSEQGAGQQQQQQQMPPELENMMRQRQQQGNQAPDIAEAENTAGTPPANAQAAGPNI